MDCEVVSNNFALDINVGKKISDGNIIDPRAGQGKYRNQGEGCCGHMVSRKWETWVLIKIFIIILKNKQFLLVYREKEDHIMRRIAI